MLKKAWLQNNMKCSIKTFCILFTAALLLIGIQACGTSPDDATITQNIQLRFEADPELAKQDVSVVTQNGDVTLVGVVTSQATAEKLISATKAVKGVKSVNPQFTIKPEPPTLLPVQTVVAPPAPQTTPAPTPGQIQQGAVQTPSQNTSQNTTQGVPQSAQQGTQGTQSTMQTPAQSTQVTLEPEQQPIPSSRQTPQGEEVIFPSEPVTITPKLPSEPPAEGSSNTYIDTDSLIIQHIKETQLSTPSVQNYEIQVQSKEGNVTLSGTVDNIYDKEIIDNIAKETGGVKSVKSDINILQK